jgi:hypothetical protein
VRPLVFVGRFVGWIVAATAAVLMLASVAAVVADGAGFVRQLLTGFAYGLTVFGVLLVVSVAWLLVEFVRLEPRARRRVLVAAPIGLVLLYFVPSMWAIVSVTLALLFDNTLVAAVAWPALVVMTAASYFLLHHQRRGRARTVVGRLEDRLQHEVPPPVELEAIVHARPRRRA